MYAVNGTVRIIYWVAAMRQAVRGNEKKCVFPSTCSDFESEQALEFSNEVHFFSFVHFFWI